MKLKFTKMHGAGNDFIVFDACTQKVDLTAEQFRFIADRRFGIGADQILIVEKPQNPATDFRYRIFNADGGEVEQCGNGARAFARFVTVFNMTDRNPVRVETKAGIIELRVEKNGNVTVNMGKPEFSPDRIPFDASGLKGKPAGDDMIWPLALELPKGLQTIEVSLVSMGNPHAVQIVENVDKAPVGETGPLIENHARFPNRTNAGFMEIENRHSIKLRVFERGAGETLACGTGACAAVVAGIRRKLLDSPVTVKARGGTLEITWNGNGHEVTMTGPAVIVFNGEIDL
ncbi:diaminopimelate epimerase [Oxalobacter paraformigenes]|uniref:Diaminopimelate epimerase n=1 Tax=Oxalobacter paraformigenes TaxID=556268 RepID=C3X748_9BURK|nr:diaminopimelate epimerase [Oxalobacter paraformigenes]EEO28942.1 diaminopimelate epimerase [Oxalobacter paraformigenes]